MESINEPREIVVSSELAPAHSTPETEIDLLDLLIVVAQRKRFVFKVTSIAAVVGVIAVLLLPNRYTANTSILPPQQSQSSAAMLLSQLAGSGIGSLASLAGKDLGLKNPNDLYIGMLKSRKVEDGLIEQFELQKVYRSKRFSDARSELESNTEILSGDDGLIDISVTDRDPTRAAALANGYVDHLRKLTQHLAVTEASQRRLFFEQELQQAKAELSTAEMALKELQQKTGAIQLDSQAKAVIEAVSLIRAQIAAKEVQLQSMRSFATPDNPDLILAQRELQALRVQQAKLERQQQPDSSDPLLATSKMPEVALEYIRRLREVKYREQLFELLAKQFEAAKLDEAKQAALIQIVDAAVPPDKKSSPKRALILILVILVAAFAACLWVWAAESIARLQNHPHTGPQLARLRSLLASSKRIRLHQQT